MSTGYILEKISILLNYLAEIARKPYSLINLSTFIIIMWILFVSNLSDYVKLLSSTILLFSSMLLQSFLRLFVHERKIKAISPPIIRDKSGYGELKKHHCILE